MKGSLPALMSPCGCLPVPSPPSRAPGPPWASASPPSSALMSGRAETSFRPLTLHFDDFYSLWSPGHTVAGRDYLCPGRSWAWPDSGGPVRGGQPFGGTGHEYWGPPSRRSCAPPVLPFSTLHQVCALVVGLRVQDPPRAGGVAGQARGC